jgi:hypothetical protein
MIVTARQLQNLHARGQTDGQIVLPYGSRLTPLALDWIRSKRLTLGYGPAEMSVAQHPKSTPAPPVAAAPSAATILWWCDGPCGPAKAALAAQSRETSLSPIELPSEITQLVPAIKHMASQIKSARAGGGVLLVKSAAEAIVFANRCPSLRAIVGTCLESVDQATTNIAPNVLILEYPYKSLPQIRNLLSRFARGPRNPSEGIQRRLGELASCA